VSVLLQQTQEWLNRINRWRKTIPVVPHHADSMSPQEVIVNCRQAPQHYTTDVGQHQNVVSTIPEEWSSALDF